MRTCCLDKRLQLESMLDICAKMGAEITLGQSNSSYFTAACREDWDMDESHVPAREIQAQIKALAAGHPDVVCFSLDCYCTLIYIV